MYPRHPSPRRRRFRWLRRVVLVLLLDELERQPRWPLVARFDRRHLYRNAVAHADEVAVSVAAQHQTRPRRADVD